MPLYEYQCDQCGRFEVIRKFSDEPLILCPTCGRDITKLPSAPAIQFKGTGWYVTDYAKKSGGGDKAGEGSSSKSNTETISKSSSNGNGKDSSSSKDSSGGSKDSTSTPTTTASKDSSAKGSSPTK